MLPFDYWMCCSPTMPALLFNCVVTPVLSSLQRMGQRGGISQEQAQTDESPGPLLLRPLCLLWCPPLPWGESVGLSSMERTVLAHLNLGSVVSMILESILNLFTTCYCLVLGY